MNYCVAKCIYFTIWQTLKKKLTIFINKQFANYYEAELVKIEMNV